MAANIEEDPLTKQIKQDFPNHVVKFAIVGQNITKERFPDEINQYDGLHPVGMIAAVSEYDLYAKMCIDDANLIIVLKFANEYVRRMFWKMRAMDKTLLTLSYPQYNILYNDEYMEIEDLSDYKKVLLERSLFNVSDECGICSNKYTGSNMFACFNCKKNWCNTCLKQLIKDGKTACPYCQTPNFGASDMGTF